MSISFEDLPQEIQFDIINLLPYKSLLAMAQTSKNCLNICNGLFSTTRQVFTLSEYSRDAGYTPTAFIIAKNKDEALQKFWEKWEENWRLKDVLGGATCHHCGCFDCSADLSVIDDPTTIEELEQTLKDIQWYIEDKLWWKRDYNYIIFDKYLREQFIE